MKIGSVEIEDTYMECFSMNLSRILVTGRTRRWAQTSAREFKGFGLSATYGPGEAAIESEAYAKDSIDRRPGYSLLFAHRDKEQHSYWLIARIRRSCIPIPSTSVFDTMPGDMADWCVEVEGTPIQQFGDGYEDTVEIQGRQMYRIPRMDGFFYIDHKLGVKKGIGGANMIILGESNAATSYAAEAAADAIRGIPYVLQPYVYGVVASGTKVSGKVYKEAYASTNDPYNACVADRVENTKMKGDLRSAHEIYFNTADLETLKKAMKLAMEAAVTIPGVKKITAGNYGGTLGKKIIYLHDLV